MRAVIFIGSGKISYGKLAQALDHGALTVQIAGDFDDALARVQQVSKKLGMKAGATKADVESAMKGHILAHAEMIGRYGR